MVQQKDTLDDYFGKEAIGEELDVSIQTLQFGFQKYMRLKQKYYWDEWDIYEQQYQEDNPVPYVAEDVLSVEGSMIRGLDYIKMGYYCMHRSPRRKE
jgi:hypothetical protein